jgi:hypothetical protein
MYQSGDGVRRDYKEAVKWYTKAAEQGNVLAQDWLGDMYSIGSDFYEGVPRDDKEAIKWYTKAAEQGYASAQYSLGIMYQSKDYKEAFKWFTKAAEQGDASAQFALGEMYYKSEGVVENHIEAYKWFLLAEMNGKRDTLKEELAYKMTPAQIAEAQKRAKEFTEKR